MIQPLKKAPPSSEAPPLSVTDSCDSSAYSPRSSPTPEHMRIGARPSENKSVSLREGYQHGVREPMVTAAQRVYTSASGAHTARSRSSHSSTPRTPLTARAALPAPRHPLCSRQQIFQQPHDLMMRREQPHEQLQQQQQLSAGGLSPIDAPLWRPDKFNHAFQQHFKPLERARRRRLQLGADALQPVPLLLPPIAERIRDSEWAPHVLRHVQVPCSRVMCRPRLAAAALPQLLPQPPCRC